MKQYKKCETYSINITHLKNQVRVMQTKRATLLKTPQPVSPIVYDEIEELSAAISHYKTKITDLEIVKTKCELECLYDS